MEKTDRGLLIKEISSRLPYGIKAQVLRWDEEKGKIKAPLRVYSINTDGYIYFKSNDYNIDYVAVDDCFLYLRPLSSMTEEEKKFYKKYFNWYEQPLEDMVELIDWLNAHHFDYRGLIEKNLALEASEDMYK